MGLSVLFLGAIAATPLTAASHSMQQSERDYCTMHQPEMSGQIIVLPPTVR